MKKRDSSNETDALSATALRYDGYQTPRVSARGEGDLAEEILKLATEHDIPIRKDEALAALLSHVDVGEEIPPMLYVAVAEALAFAYLLQDELRTIQDAGPDIER